MTSTSIDNLETEYLGDRLFASMQSAEEIEQQDPDSDDGLKPADQLTLEHVKSTIKEFQEAVANLDRIIATTTADRDAHQKSLDAMIAAEKVLEGEV